MITVPKLPVLLINLLIGFHLIDLLLINLHLIDLRYLATAVEICYTYLNRIVSKCVHILADS